MKEDIICAAVAIAVSVVIMFLLSVIKKMCKKYIGRKGAEKS